MLSDTCSFINFPVSFNKPIYILPYCAMNGEHLSINDKNFFILRKISTNLRHSRHWDSSRPRQKPSFVLDSAHRLKKLMKITSLLKPLLLLEDWWIVLSVFSTVAWYTLGKWKFVIKYKQLVIKYKGQKTDNIPRYV